ncbi:MAG: DUF6089 family protein [Bacteroidota bacterium]
MKALNVWASILLLLLIGTNEANAQYRHGYFKIGVSAGATNYLGDLDDDLTFKFTKPGLGAYVSYRFNPLMSARLGVFQGWAGASDAQNTNADRVRRNLSFRTQIREVSAQLVIDFLPSHRRYFFRPKYVPYIFGGIGIFSFNPQAQLNGEWIELQPLGTEGQFLSDPDNVYPEPYNLTQVSIPMGGGIRIALNRRWDLEFEAGWRKTFTDYLDDVSGFYPDMDELRADNPTSFLLSDRIDRSVFPQGAAQVNGIRGDNTQDDWYIYTNVTLSFILDWVKCPTFR